jgi:hypothetical protein
MPFKDPAERRRYNREWMARRRAEWFAGKTCVDCGATERLEVHHRDPEQKISHRVWTWADDRREAELAKCEPLCRPCHFKRHKRVAAHGGERRYRQGCRCAVCVEGWAQVNAARRVAAKLKRASKPRVPVLVPAPAMATVHKLRPRPVVPQHIPALGEPFWGEPVQILGAVRTPLLKPSQAAEALNCTVGELGVRWWRGEVVRYRIGSSLRYELVDARGC